MTDKSHFDFIAPESQGMCAVQKDDAWGFINSKGEIVVAPHYTIVAPFADGLAAVCLNDKWGFINSQGTVVVAIEYERVYAFACGRAAVMINGKWGFIDTSGNVVVPACYDEVDKFVEGVARVRQSLHWGYIKSDATQLTPVKYSEAYNNYHGNLVVNEGGVYDVKWGVVTGGSWLILCAQTGSPLTGKCYDNLSCFVDGYAKASIGCFCENDCFVGGRWGYVDCDGKECIPLEYDEVSNMSEGYVKVRKGFKFGLVDMEGNTVVPVQFEFISNVNYGSGFVVCDGQKYPLGKDGVRYVGS